MTSLLFSAALAVSGCVPRFAIANSAPARGGDVGEKRPRYCCRASILRKQKS